MNTVLLIILLLIGLRWLAQMWLDYLNRREVLAHADTVPQAFREFIDDSTYDKSVSYTLAKNRFGVFEGIVDTLILVLILTTGILPMLWYGITDITGTGVWGQALALFGIGIVLSLPGIPLEWYEQFRLEERFGFNKSTLGLWITDKIKGFCIGFVLGVPVLAMILWLVSVSDFWWLWGFLFFFVFQLVMLVVYPMFIMPLFNKFEELPEGDLRKQLMDLANRTGFKARTILVMDGSKRSGHSNAFFTGFGRFRRIVLFDTLMEQMSPKQLEAVLAHEIGHYKLGHIPKMLAVSAISLFISFALIGWLAESPWFVEAFGFEYTSGQLGPVLLLFGMLAGVFTFWLSPLTNRFSRKHEYEADSFALRSLENDPEPMIGALRELNAKNLSNLTPHPLYSAFYYSHPTLLEREGNLQSANA